MAKQKTIIEHARRDEAGVRCEHACWVKLQATTHENRSKMQTGPRRLGAPATENKKQQRAILEWKHLAEDVHGN